MAAAPRVTVVRAPGTNCDLETAHAFELEGAVVQRLHIERIVENQTILDDSEILCVAGGFSYGDDIAAGRLLADRFRHGMSDTMRRFRERDTLILGICNGFQVLLQTGLLLDEEVEHDVTLGWNDSGHFEDRWVHLQVHAQHNVFLQAMDQLYLPVAHAEGKLLASSTSVLDRLDQQGQVVLTYANEPGDDSPVGYPANPNGSMRHVAGLGDRSGRVFGLMPHPERFIEPTHHPRWTRCDTPPSPHGRRIFQNAVRYFAN